MFLEQIPVDIVWLNNLVEKKMLELLNNKNNISERISIFDNLLPGYKIFATMHKKK